MGAVLLAIGVVSFSQESTALRHLGLGFAWGSGADGCSAAALILPVLWTVRLGPAANDWERRYARSGHLLTLGRILGLLVIVAMVAVVGTLMMLALERAFVGTTDLRAALVCALRTAAVGLPAAALAPAIVGIARRASSILSIWVGLFALGSGMAGIGFPIPLDRLSSLGEVWGAGSGRTALASAMATLAGLTVSMALGTRHAPAAETSSCASASSATSTATSKP